MHDWVVQHFRTVFIKLQMRFSLTLYCSLNLPKSEIFSWENRGGIGLFHVLCFSLSHAFYCEKKETKKLGYTQTFSQVKFCYKVSLISYFHHLLLYLELFFFFSKLRVLHLFIFLIVDSHWYETIFLNYVLWKQFWFVFQKFYIFPSNLEVYLIHFIIVWPIISYSFFLVEKSMKNY